MGIKKKLSRHLNEQKMFSKNHITALDGIRGVSVLCVILAHHVRFPLAFLAMDCFFVLSGFFINKKTLKIAFTVFL